MQTQNTLDNWLQTCDRNFGNVPRQFNWFDRHNYLSIRSPAWAKNDSLQTFFKNQSDLMTRGRLVWGSLIQANNYLFSYGRESCPADVVFPIRQIPNLEPEILRDIASQIFQLKNTEPTDPSLATIAKHMTDECDRVFGMEVPKSISPNIPCEISTIFVDRKHLPNGYLSRALFPLIISPEKPRIAAILPSRYWSPATIDWWLGEN